ncbi:MAG: hypothetical protein ACLFVB_02030 [Thermoplasmata archaeon]
MDRLSIVQRLDSLRISVFTTPQVSALLDKDMSSTKMVLSRLNKDDILTRVKKGHYCLPSSPILSVASNIYTPSYISLWSAFRYYGTTTQSPQVIHVINTDKSGRREITLEEGEFKLRFIKTDRSFLFGFNKIYQDGKTVFMAEKEKAIVDGLWFHNYVPLGEIIEAIKDGIDVKKAVEYAEKSDKQVVMKRLGYLMSEQGLECEPDDFGTLSDTFIPLDPSFPRRGSFDSKWYVIDNRRQK